jgi:TubC N-terminal docking domain
MTALEDLRTRLIDMKVRLSASGGKLVVDAPAGVLTSELKAELAEHKPALLDCMSGGISDVDALAQIASLKWDDISLAGLIESGRRHTEEVNKRK